MPSPRAASRSKPKLILARATVKMQGVRAGEVVEVNPADSHIAKLLRAKLLVQDAPPEGDQSVNDGA